MAEQNFSGKVVVITGASSGIGKGAALKFAEAGASVVIAARRGELLETLAQECQAAGGKALAVTTDVSKEADVIHLAQQAVSAFGRIDVWINNAGSGAVGRFEEDSDGGTRSSHRDRSARHDLRQLSGVEPISTAGRRQSD